MPNSSVQAFAPVGAAIVPVAGDRVYAELLFVKVMALLVVLVIVVTLVAEVAVALGLAAQAAPPQEPSIAFARLVASVVVLPTRVMQ